MWKTCLFALGGLLCSLGTSQVIFQPQNAANADDNLQTTPINLTDIFNNRAFGKKPGDANFDTYHSSYPASSIPPAHFIYNGINFTFAQYKAAGNDNALAQGQIVNVPRGRYLSVSMLAAAETGLGAGFVNASYADGSKSSGQVLVPAWWSWPYPAGGDLVFPYYYSNRSVDYNRSNIFQTMNWLDSTKELTSITLPNVTAGSDSGPGGSAITTRLHIFSLSLLSASLASSDTANLEVQYARSTNMWFPNTNKTQIIEVSIANSGTSWILSNNTVNVTIVADGIHTVQPGVIKRLAPGDQALLSIGIKNLSGMAAGTNGTARVVLTTPGGHSYTVHTFNATFGITPYEASYESIYSHESPKWYNDAKYGIFIHWGVYAVPGWGNVGKNETYAEWYWWNLNQGPNTTDQTYEHHLKTYGPNVVYDDFIANFTAANFTPKDWVDLFADAGANYFVQVSKHHDGYAIFDLPENVTKRTSVAQFPHRNLLQELFDAADKYQPHLHKATYYSLPEWFHPDYKKYGFGSWPGGNATNPFNNETLPYTGYVPVSNYITDVIVPEMTTLANMGTEIMWCDIGGPNVTTTWAAEWFNSQMSQNRQVVLNARCGVPGDFDTPEYARYGAVQRRKWESNLGMDPFSYGYNRATPLSQYLNASGIVQSLVDIVSKNGNFLLDVGPMSNGMIVEVEQRNLREAGTWIGEHGEAIFETRYWTVAPEEGNVRFTTTGDAFYLSVLEKPANGVVELESPVPWVAGDKVTVVGGKANGTVVPIERFGQRGVKLNVSASVWEADRWCWVFKITY